jgi:hypothetical protein
MTPNIIISLLSRYRERQTVGPGYTMAWQGNSMITIIVAGGRRVPCGQPDEQH